MFDNSVWIVTCFLFDEFIDCMFVGWNFMVAGWFYVFYDADWLLLAVTLVCCLDVWFWLRRGCWFGVGYCLFCIVVADLFCRGILLFICGEWVMFGVWFLFGCDCGLFS